MTRHYVDLAGNPVLEGFLVAHRFSDGLARVVRRDGRGGLINARGELLSPPDVDFVLSFHEDLALTNRGGTWATGNLRGGQWQLMDRQGQLVGESLAAEVVLDVSDGLATFRVGKLWGFMNNRGGVVVEPRYSYLSPHREGLAVAATDGGDVYLDLEGNVAIAGPFEEATNFRGGVAPVKIGGSWGVIDRTGKLVHEAVYTKIGPMVDGVAWATGEAGVSVLGPAGVLATGLKDAKAPREGVVPVCREGVWSLLHVDGQQFGEFDDVHAPTDGWSMAKKGEHWGYVDVRGAIQVPLEFDTVIEFKGGIAAGRKGDAWQLLTAQGPVGGSYDAVGFPSEGTCPVKKDGLWGYVGAEGTMLIPPKFCEAGSFNAGLAAVHLPRVDADAVLDSADIPHVLPEGGLRHPVFEGAAVDSRVGAIIGFARRLTGPELEFVRASFAAWGAAVAPQWGWKDVTSSWLSLQVSRIENPLLKITALIEQLRTLVPISEIIFSRWEHPEGERVAGPVEHPGTRSVNVGSYFSTFDEYWDAAWSADGPVPGWESAPNLKGAFFNREDKIVLEQREMPIWFPDVRVCFGALSASGEEYLPSDDRTASLQAALQGALDERFGRVWSPPNANAPRPTVGTRAGDPGIERMTYNGRTGYSFAVDSSSLLHWHAPSVCRYREPELLDAIRGVMVQHELAPVLMWRRFQRQMQGMPMGTPTVVVINLWER